jgi:hypothetical protein
LILKRAVAALAPGGRVATPDFFMNDERIETAADAPFLVGLKPAG